MTDEEVVVRNVQRIRDVQTMLDLLERLGATVEWRDANEVSIRAGTIDSSGAERKSRARAMRSRITNRCGGTPVLPLNSRAKW